MESGRLSWDAGISRSSGGTLPQMISGRLGLERTVQHPHMRVRPAHQERGRQPVVIFPRLPHESLLRFQAIVED